MAVCEVPGIPAYRPWDGNGVSVKLQRVAQTTIMTSSPDSSFCWSSSGVIPATRKRRRKSWRARNFQSRYVLSPPARIVSSQAPMVASRAASPSSSLAISAPRPMKTPIQRSAPRPSKGTNRPNGIRVTPARGGATVLRPGMNLATSRAELPRRENRFSVCRTHKSGSRESQQSRCRIPMLRRRPSAYQLPSLAMVARTAMPRIRARFIRPVAASAPAASSNGTAGMASPLLEEHPRKQHRVAMVDEELDCALHDQVHSTGK